MIALLRLEIDKNDQELSTTSNFFELYLFKKFPSLTRKIWSPFDLDDKNINVFQNSYNGCYQPGR